MLKGLAHINHPLEKQRKSNCSWGKDGLVFAGERHQNLSRVFQKLKEGWFSRAKLNSVSLLSDWPQDQQWDTG